MAKKRRKSKARGGKKRGTGGRKKSFLSGQRGSAMLPPKSIVIHGLQRVANGAEGVGAAKISQFAISKLPIANPKLKAGLQALIGGLAGIWTDKHPWLRGLADGPYYIGLAGVARAFNTEVMAGEEDYHLVMDKDGNVHEMS